MARDGVRWLQKWEDTAGYVGESSRVRMSNGKKHAGGIARRRDGKKKKEQADNDRN